MSIETMKLALDALTFSKSDSMAVEELIDDAIVALEEELAKQEQGEPVAHWSDCAVNSEPAYLACECDCGCYSPDKELLDSARAFYNATVADSQVRISSSSQEKRDAAFNASERLRFALLAKLKATDEDLKVYQSIADNYFKDTTPPQQRTWVGLTYDERVSIIDADENCSSRELCERIEKKLKEKNTIIKTYPKKDKT
jgi:hypothetical protein